ncbi:hypothetical protein P3W45_000249 [Vairimorpha bombi]|jgi:hypothetical protein
MNLIIYFVISLCRYVELAPKETLTIKDKVTRDTMYKFIYNTFGAKKVLVEMFDPLKRRIGNYKKGSGVIFTKPSHNGLVQIKITNPNSTMMKFGYRCPDVNKEFHGVLGPIKDVDAVSELLIVLENNIKSQRRQLEKYEKHFAMVKKSKKWVFRFVVFEIVSSIIVMYYLHKSTLKMFEKKHGGN